MSLSLHDFRPARAGTVVNLNSGLGCVGGGAAAISRPGQSA